eukprot:COSAG03_NODE_2399_length_2811_cov_1.112463_2_plen_31_part_00
MKRRAIGTKVRKTFINPTPLARDREQFEED